MVTAVITTTAKVAVGARMVMVADSRLRYGAMLCRSVNQYGGGAASYQSSGSSQLEFVLTFSVLRQALISDQRLSVRRYLPYLGPLFVESAIEA